MKDQHTIDQKVGAMIEDIELFVRKKIEETFSHSKNPDLANAKIISLELIHQRGHKYRGMLETTLNGETVKFIIDVKYYNDKIFNWKATPTMKKCKDCGKQLSPSAVTCPNCGAQQPMKMSNLALVFWIAVALVVLGPIVLIILGYAILWIPYLLHLL